MSTYLGVYSQTSATTKVGTELQQASNRIKLEVPANKFAKSDRHTFSTESLKESNLNVAKIRVVSTIPGKTVATELQGLAYVGFILTEVQESHNEKAEVIPLPGDTFASYFYGASPRTFTFNGVLLNTEQDQWRDSFEQMYEKYLRGSASSREFNIVQVRYDGRIVSGWLMGMNQQMSSQSDLFCQFSFTVLVSRVDLTHTRAKNKYTSYLVKEHDTFDGANLNTDYAILDPKNFNAMINPIRTGTVVPPKRPKRGGGKRRSNNNCSEAKPIGDGGGTNHNGDVSISNNVKEGRKCLVYETITNMRAKLATKTKELTEMTAKYKAGKISKETLQAKQTEVTTLENSIRDYAENKDVKEAAREQATGILSRGDTPGSLTESKFTEEEREAFGLTEGGTDKRKNSRLGSNLSSHEKTYSSKDVRNAQGQVIATVTIETKPVKDGKGGWVPVRKVVRSKVHMPSQEQISDIQSDAYGKGAATANAGKDAHSNAAMASRKAQDAIADKRKEATKNKTDENIKKGKQATQFTVVDSPTPPTPKARD